LKVTHSVVVNVALPGHLRRLAGISTPLVAAEVRVRGSLIPEEVTLGAVLDALEEIYPAFEGVFYETDFAPGQQRVRRLRPFLRFFAGKKDLTALGPAAPLPPEVSSGREPLRIVGAIAGGSRDLRLHQLENITVGILESP